MSVLSGSGTGLAVQSAGYYLMQRFTIGRVVILSAVLVAPTSCGRLSDSASTDVARGYDAPLRQALQSARQPPFVTNDREGARLWKQTRAFYGK